jgi:hypothetical protein
MFENFTNFSNYAKGFLVKNRGIIIDSYSDLNSLLKETRRLQILYKGALYPNLVLHKYVYCANNPINLIDPAGESFLQEIFLLALGVLTAVSVTLYAIQLIVEAFGGHLTLEEVIKGGIDQLYSVIYTLLQWMISCILKQS